MLNYGRRKTQEKVVVNEDKLVKEKSKSVIKSGPSSELMERLATGGKAKVRRIIVIWYKLIGKWERYV